MRVTIALLAGLMSTVAIQAGCGSDSDSSTPGASDGASYQSLASKVRTAVDAYHADMMGAGAGMAMCGGRHDAYDDEVRPWVMEMMGQAGPMDDFMRGHGGGMMADNSCVSAGMMDEFDRHHAAACTGADMESIRNEVERHYYGMTAYAGHMQARGGEMMHGDDQDGWDWIPPQSGCED